MCVNACECVRWRDCKLSIPIHAISHTDIVCFGRCTGAHQAQGLVCSQRNSHIILVGLIMCRLSVRVSRMPPPWGRPPNTDLSQTQSSLPRRRKGTCPRDHARGNIQISGPHVREHPNSGSAVQRRVCIQIVVYKQIYTYINYTSVCMQICAYTCICIYVIDIYTCIWYTSIYVWYTCMYAIYDTCKQMKT